MPWPDQAALNTFNDTIDSQGLDIPEADSLHTAANAITVTPPSPTKSVIVCDGTSITQGTGATDPTQFSYPAQLLQHLGSEKYSVSNLGAGGDRMSQIISGSSAVDLLYDPSAPKNICILEGGTNDLYDGRTGDAVYADIVSYCQARQAVGWKVIVLTILSRNPPALPASFEPERAVCNALIRANWRTFADALCDVDADVRLQDPNDQTYFSGPTHPNNAGLTIYADYCGALILNMYP